MDSVFKVTPLKNTKLQEYKEEAMKELNEFFEKNWVRNTPKLFVFDDRKTSNLLREEETEDYIAAWSYGTFAIFILNPENITEESSHHRDTYNLEQRIKHELCHSFFYQFFGKSNFNWINEGVAIYTSGELFDRYPMPEKFKGFLDNKNVYAESGGAFKLLLDNFGKETVFNFFRKQSRIKDKNKIEAVFNEVFKADLSYSFFNSLNNKKT